MQSNFRKLFIKVIVDQGFQLTSLKSELQLRIFVTFFFFKLLRKTHVAISNRKKKIKEIMVKNNCQLNLFQEESPYEQSFFIMYFCCASYAGIKEIHSDEKLETLMYS